MSSISAAQVASLRQRTGVGLLAVKQALEEAAGDEEKAIGILRKRGEAMKVKKAAREQGEGNIFIETANGKVAIVQLACETDFVARSGDFQNAGRRLAKTALEQGGDAAKNETESLLPDLINALGENISLADVRVTEGGIIGTYVHTNGKIGVIIALDGGDATKTQALKEKAHDIAMHAAAMAPEVVSPDEMSAAAVEKEKEVWREQLRKEGKPEPIWDKIMIGKEKKFREENALLTQPFAKNPAVTIEQYLNGAKITVYVRLAV